MLRLLLTMVAIGVAYLFHLTFRFLTSPHGLLAVLLVLGSILLLAGLAYAGLLYGLGAAVRLSDWYERREQARADAWQSARMREIYAQMPERPTVVEEAQRFPNDTAKASSETATNALVRDLLSKASDQRRRN